MAIARSAFLTLLVGCSCYAEALDQRAEARLRELFSSFDVCGVFIQNFREPGATSARKIMIQTDQKQRSLWTTLEPLSQQGQKTFDDGQYLHFFIGDQKAKWSVPQSIAPPLTASRRMELILENYELKMLRSEKHLGRVCDRILAKPKLSEMPSRLFWVDAKVPFLMRTELHQGKTKTNLVDTLTFTLEKTLDIELPDTKGWREIKPWGPKSLNDLYSREAIDRVRKIIGAPVGIPRTLPMGFEIINANLNGSSASNAYLVIRLSDGLANATIVQTALGFQRLNIPDSKGGHASRFYVMGDVPSNVKQALLGAFLSAEPKR